MRLIDLNNPTKAVVFCNTKRKVDDLIEKLKSNGYKAESLHGDIKQAQRDRIMKRFKTGEFQILVATDVVARGIDVDELELVINYDIPQEEYYVHRIGRTGRNGKIGKAYTFVVGKEKSKIYSIQKYANTKILSGKIPTIEQIKKVKNQKMIDDIQEIIDTNKNEESEINDEILEKLLQKNDIKIVAKALLSLITNKKENKELQNFDFKPGEEIKLFLNVGKKDKIMVKDIVGSISANTAVSGSDLGKINILDKFSFIEVPGEYVNEILISMKNKQIKGRDVRIEVANG